MAANAAFAAEAGFGGGSLRGDVVLPDSQLDPARRELVEAPAAHERECCGGDATVAMLGSDAVAELDRIVLTTAQEDDADHFVTLPFGDHQRRAETTVAPPGTLELGEKLGRLRAVGG